MRNITFLILIILIFLSGCSSKNIQEPVNQSKLQSSTMTPSPESVSPIVSEEDKMIQLSMVSMETGFALTEESHILKTTDGGKLWTEVYTVNKEDIRTGLCPAIYSVDDNTLYIVAHYDGTTNFLSTTDAGKTWSSSTVSSDLSWVNDDVSDYNLDFIDSDNGYLLIDCTPGAGQMLKALYKTTDAGENWVMVVGDEGGEDNIPGITPSGISGYPHGIAFSNLEKGWIVSGSNGAPPYGLYINKTNDGGKHWSTINFPEFPKEVSKWNESELYVSASEPSFYGRDKKKSKVIMVFHPYTQGENNSAYIYSISDKDTWVLKGKCNTIINDYKFMDDINGVGLDEDGNICKTKDGGITWTKVNSFIDVPSSTSSDKSVPATKKRVSSKKVTLKRGET